MSQGKFIITYFFSVTLLQSLKPTVSIRTDIGPMLPHSLPVDKYLLREFLPGALGQGYRQQAWRGQRQSQACDFHKARGSADLWEWISSRIRQVMELKVMGELHIKLKAQKVSGNPRRMVYLGEASWQKKPCDQS